MYANHVDQGRAEMRVEARPKFTRETKSRANSRCSTEYGVQ